MFVSSYNTYISNINTNKTQKQDDKKVELKKESSFDIHLKQNEQVLTSKVDTHTPINYISNYKSFANKQKLQENLELTKNTDRFSKINTLKSAKESYETNTRMFPRVRVPHLTLSQVQEKNELPKKLQHKMVNTYIENDRYYKVTA